MPSFSLLSVVVCLPPVTCSIAVFALKMTFDPISYVYMPTAPRSKSIKSGHKIENAERVSTSSKTKQHIQPGATTLDTQRPSVAEDTGGNGYDETRAEGEFEFWSFCSSD
jgi:hypothetical protein